MSRYFGLRFTADNLENTDWVATVDFYFHKELDGQIVYDGAFDIRWADDGQTMQFNGLDHLIPAIIKWMSEYEWLVINYGEKVNGNGWNRPDAMRNAVIPESTAIRGI